MRTLKIISIVTLLNLCASTYSFAQIELLFNIEEIKADNNANSHDISIRQVSDGAWSVSGYFTNLNTGIFVINGYYDVGILIDADSPKLMGGGTVHTLFGKVNLKGYMFDSDPSHPLTFYVTIDQGYVYLCGKGTVIDPNGNEIADLGKTDSFESLAMNVESGNYVERLGAAIALGRLKFLNSTEPLIKALKDEELSIRARAVEALGIIGDSSATKFLVPIITHENPILAGKAADAIRLIGKGLSGKDQNNLLSLVEKANSHTQINAVIALAASSPNTAVVKKLETILKENRKLAKYAAESLGTMQARTSKSILLQSLKSSEKRVIKGAAFGLGELGEPDVINDLLPLLAHEETGIRYTAAQALGKIGHKAALESLAGILNNENYETEVTKVHKMATQALLQLNSISDETISSTIKLKGEDAIKRFRQELDEIVIMNSDKQLRERAKNLLSL